MNNNRVAELGLGRDLPVFQSAEAAECGLVCLAMIARYHGRNVDVNGLRQRFHVSMAGMSLRTLMGLCGDLGLGCRAIRAEPEALQKLQNPAIIHWNFVHYVVLKEINDKRAIIHDPAKGRVVVSPQEFSDRFTGVALEVAPTDDFEEIYAKRPVTLSSLWSRLDGMWKSGLQLLLMSVALQIAILFAPLQTQLIIDNVLPTGDTGLLWTITIAFGLLLILRVAIQLIRDWALRILGAQLSYQMVGNLVHHLFSLSVSYFGRRHVGDILSRIQSANVIQEFFTTSILAAIFDSATAMIALTILFIYSPLLTLIVIVGIAISLLISLAFFPLLQAKQSQKIVASAGEQSLLMEAIRAMPTIKLAGRGAEREGSWRNRYVDVINAGSSYQQINILIRSLQSLATGLQTSAVLVVGAWMVIQEQGLSMGMLVAFIAYREMLTNSCISLITQFTQYRLLGLHLDRLSDIITAVPDRIESVSRPREVVGRIALRNIKFRYGISDSLVLDGLNLEIGRGDFIAITGPSGGGKTSLLNLIAGLDEPISGEILLDGVPATKEVLGSWRSRVGVVLQDDRLLAGTIAENICFFDPEMNLDAMVRAAKAARIHEDIERKPMGYRSLIGDMGSALSAGQRQRIFLARALYREPDVLILDEGTANLDPEAEAAIADLIAGLSITRIVVAHRPALLSVAKKIYRLEGGLLREQSEAGRALAVG